MTRQNPRVGIVGAGDIARTHLAAYATAGTRAVAVTDLDTARTAAVAEELGAVGYPDLATMLTDAELDAVTICTPPSQHLSNAVQALEAGVAVLCEKPMAASSDECIRMIEAADASGAILTVAFCHRFQPQVEVMRAAAERGEIGTVLSFRNRFAGALEDVENRWYSRREVAGGGVLMNNGVHSVDLFRYLVGEVADVRALTSTTPTALGPALSVDDTAMLAVRSSSGVLGVIEASWRTRPGEYMVSLHGTDGTLHADYGTSTLTYHPADGGAPRPVEVDPGDRFVRQARHFLACLRGEESPRATARDGAVAIAVLAAAYESAEAAGPLPAPAVPA